MSDINPHFTIGRAIPTGDTLSAIGSDPEAGEIFLLYPQDSRHWAAKSTPNARSEYGIKTHADDTAENSPNQKTIPLTDSV